VKAGQALATIESNESLQIYTVTAPIAGTVTARRTNPGEAAGSEPLFEIANLSTVWAELSVFPRDRGRLKLGQPVTISATDGVATGSGTLSYVSPLGAASQVLTARVVLDNADGVWTPGQFVNARITVGEAPAKVVVPLSALQSFRDWEVVFVTDGQHYQAQPVELGRRDTAQAEVLSGLEPGAQVVVQNSYLLKADIEKSGASHDH
jgi:membrane fusion protein, heavy metal efflux system